MKIMSAIPTSQTPHSHCEYVFNGVPPQDSTPRNTPPHTHGGVISATATFILGGVCVLSAHGASQLALIERWTNDAPLSRVSCRCRVGGERGEWECSNLDLSLASLNIIILKILSSLPSVFSSLPILLKDLVERSSSVVLFSISRKPSPPPPRLTQLNGWKSGLEHCIYPQHTSSQWRRPTLRYTLPSAYKSSRHFTASSSSRRTIWQDTMYAMRHPTLYLRLNPADLAIE